MPRPCNITRSIKVTISLPEDLWARLVLHLTSDLLGKPPHGALKEFFSAQIREYFDKLEAARDAAIES